MKTFIAVVVAVAVIGVAGYFGVNALITREAEGIRSEIKNLEQRVRKMEEEATVSALPADADANKIIKTVNALSLQVKGLEDSLRKELSATNDSFKKQTDATGELFKKQSEAIDRNHKELQQQLKAIKFDAAMANIRGHILKTRMELVAKNVGNAKTEIDFIDDLFEKSLGSAHEDGKKIITDMQASLKKAKTEIDTDIPSVTNRVNTLWYDMSRLIRKN